MEVEKSKHLIPSHVKALEKSGKEMQIYPVLRAKTGEIIDGYHRKASNPNWKEVVVDVKDPIKIVVMQIEANLRRRDVSKEEKKEWVLRIQKELKKQGGRGSTREIARELGLSQNTIVKWLQSDSQAISELSLSDRKIVPYGENIFYLSELNFKNVRKDSYHTINDGDPFPTLKRRSWFFHPNGREYSLREYADVQEFPDDFIFVGSKKAIKDQIGNAVPPSMAYHIAKKIPKSNAIELFAGCGGMALGFKKANHKVLWANDNNRYCYYTYRANFPKIEFSTKDIEKIKVEDIKNKVKNKINLIFGGVPCQGFSLAGVRFIDDDRNKYYKHFLRIVEGLDPKYFVMENVMGIMAFKEQIVKDMEDVGYNVKVEIIKGEEIGMRQRRNRVFFMGKRNG